MIIDQAPRGPSFDSLVDVDEELTLLNATDTCLLDKFKMEQVLRNLVSNALKFSPSGGMVTVNAYFVPSITGEEWLHEGGHKAKDHAHQTKGGLQLTRRRRLQQQQRRPPRSEISTHSIMNSVNNVIHHTIDAFIPTRPSMATFSEKTKLSHSGKHRVGENGVRKLSSQLNGIMSHFLGSEGHANETSKVFVSDVEPHREKGTVDGLSLDAMEKRVVGENTCGEVDKRQRGMNVGDVDEVVDSAGGGGVYDNGLGIRMTGTLNDLKNDNASTNGAVPHATHQEEGIGHDGDDMVTIRGRRGRLIITVTDTGPGISSDNQKRLFKEIVQFNPEKLQAGGGSGFGLFISQGIIDLHDGCMGVYSQGEGHGATFSITIPMIRQAFAPRASITTLNLKLSEALRQSNKSEHSHHNDHRRMSQKSQNSYKVPSLNLSPPGGGSGDSNSRGHSVVVGVLDDGMGGDVLVDVDDFVFRGDVTNGTTGRSTGSGSRHHTVTFLSLGHTFQAFLIYLTTPASNHVLS